MGKLTNQDRLARPEWDEADIETIMCPECGAAPTRVEQYVPGTGRVGKLDCGKCGWHAERPMKKETTEYETGT